jgi:signal transduction histidine kinase
LVVSLFADSTLIVLILSGIACLVLLAAVLGNRGVREAATQLLAVYGLASLAWIVVQTLLRLQQLALVRGFDLFALERIALYLLAGQALIFYQLTRRFERREGQGLPGWLAGTALLTLAILLYENPLRLPDLLPVGNGAAILRRTTAFYCIVAGWFIFLGSALVVTLRSFRSKVSPLHRNRNTYWLLAVLLVINGQALILVRLFAAGSVLHVLALVAAVYAQLTYNLPDLRVFGRRSLVFFITGAATAAVYTGGYLAMQAIARGSPGFRPAAAGLLLAVVMVFLFNPLLNLVQRFIRHLIDGSRYDARQTLSEYSMSVSNILDMELLATVVIGLISEAMEITHGALVSVEHEPGEVFWEESNGSFLLRSISGVGQALPEGCLSSRNPAAYFLRREHHPLTQYDIDLLPRFQIMEPEERRWLAGLNMDVYVPIYAKDAWIGLLALGPKISGDRYFPEDLALLQTLADQTAVALENARLYEHLKQRNAENEQLNEELKTANIELARLDRAKSDFINIASHELRTPLTQVIGYNDILGEMIRANDLHPATGVQMVDNVRKAARRLEEIVETMFDVSKLEARTLDLMHAPVSLTSVISVAIDTWTRGIEDRGQSISVRGIASLPAIVADGKRLTQVFSHLIQNAIKSTPDGGQIRINGRVMEMENNGDGPADEKYVEIVVADTGIGIAQDDLERVFEKFYRVGNVLLHSSGDTKFKGAGPGLGLTIARGIVEAHGGRIWAESPGYDEDACPGAKFHVLLPIRTLMAES